MFRLHVRTKSVSMAHNRVYKLLLGINLRQKLRCFFAVLLGICLLYTSDAADE